jgi:hypothetical protein
VNTRGGKPWLPTLTFMALSMLIGVGLARIIFFREFANGTADFTGAAIAVHSRLAAREHR